MGTSKTHFLEKSHLIVLFRDFLWCEDRHLRGNLIFVNQLLKNLIKLAPIGGVALVFSPKLTHVFLLDPREAPVELIIIPITRTSPQSHAKPRENIFRAACVRLFDQSDDVFFGISDKGQNGHHCHPGVDARISQLSHGCKPGRRGGSAWFDLSGEIVICSRNRKTNCGINLVNFIAMESISSMLT